MIKPEKTILEINLDYLKLTAPNIYQDILPMLDQPIGWDAQETIKGDTDYIFKGSNSTSIPLNCEIIPRLLLQRSRPRLIKMARTFSEEPCLVNETIVQSMLDSDSYELAPALLDKDALLDPSNDVQEASADSAFLFGSFSLLPLSNNNSISDVNIYPSSIVLFETELEQFYALLSLVNLREYFSTCREVGVKFTFEYHESVDEIKDIMFDYFISKRPSALASTLVIQSPCNINNELLHSYAFSLYGLGGRLFGGLGASTDEFNQLLHGLCNAIQPNRNILIKAETSSNKVCVVGSGPSVDDSLDDIRFLQEQSVPIFAAGSAIGVLLRNGFCPDALILLERSTEVLDDLLELTNEGFSLDDITLIYSLNVHPDIPSKFKTSYAYHRPLSASTPLFTDEIDSIISHSGPLSANAAFDIACHQGFSEIILVGCDFSGSSSSERSISAVGRSERNLDIPMKSNSSTTVRTNADLILSRDTIQSIMLTYPAVKILRIGTGLPIEGENLFDRSQLFEELNSKNHKSFHPSFKNLEHSSKQIVEKCNGLLEASQFYFSGLCALLQDSTSWNNLNHDKLAPHLIVNHPTHLSEPYLEVLVRLNRQFIMNLIVQLFYSKSDPELWIQRKLAVIHILERMANINELWFSLCKRYLDGFPEKTYAEFIDYSD